MKVKELIKVLQKFDPELEVLSYKGESISNKRYNSYGTDILKKSEVMLCENKGKEFIEIR